MAQFYLNYFQYGVIFGKFKVNPTKPKIVSRFLSHPRTITIKRYFKLSTKFSFTSVTIEDVKIITNGLLKNKLVKWSHSSKCFEK